MFNLHANASSRAQPATVFFTGYAWSYSLGIHPYRSIFTCIYLPKGFFRRKTVPELIEQPTNSQTRLLSPSCSEALVRRWGHVALLPFHL